jgi:hypothetical protein
MKSHKTRKKIRTLLNQIATPLFSKTPKLGKQAQQIIPPVNITEENFDKFTYSQHTHFNVLKIPEIHLHEHSDMCDLKVYQDIIIYNFLVNNFRPGSRFLEIGGGNSRVVQCLKGDFDIWNLDKLEGEGHGPLSVINSDGYHLVQDYIGKFNSSLPSEGFDCVYSISVLEHIPESPEIFRNIVDDIHRLFRPGGYSLHCIDTILKGSDYPREKITRFLYEHTPVVNPYIPASKVNKDPDLWVLPAYVYYSRWITHTRKSYAAFGRVMSYNILYKKPNLERK